MFAFPRIPRRAQLAARISRRLSRQAVAAACLGGSLLAVCQPGLAQAAQPLVKVRYEEVVRSVLYLPMYVALHRNLFKEAGLDVGMKTSQGTDKGMAALLSGSADIVLIGPEASVYVAGSESPVKPRIFAGLTATDGFLLMSREPAPAGGFDWSRLKGKNIMSFRPGSNPDVFLETALRKHGLDPKQDVKLVNNIGPAARMGAWLAGQNDYATFLEPEAGALEKDGKGYVLASVGAEAGPVDYTVFTTTDTYIRQHPEVLKAWTQVIAQADRIVQSAPADQLAADVAEFFPGITQPELAHAIERYRTYHLWKATPAVTAQAIETLQDMLVTSGVLEPGKRVPYDQLVVGDFTAQVQ
ncbi:MAG TPA: ABC transporter substrate-binding protein [Bordetella sp.]